MKHQIDIYATVTEGPSPWYSHRMYGRINGQPFEARFGSHGDSSSPSSKPGWLTDLSKGQFTKGEKIAIGKKCVIWEKKCLQIRISTRS